MVEGRLSRRPQGRVIAVMVVWNGRRFLERAVSSVLAELGEEDDLLVVDNGSTDGSGEFLRERFPQAAILATGENLGGAGGFSAGMRAALRDEGCRQVWLLDNDIEAEPGALSALREALDADAGVAAVGSQLCLYDDPERVQELGSRYSPWLGALRQVHHGEPRLAPDSPPRAVDYLPACSLLVRRDALERAGLFREEFFVFYDDVEWSLRIRAQGGVIKAAPGSVVRHCYGGGKETVPWREYYRKRNRCACLSLFPPRLGGRLALLIYLMHVNSLARFFRLQGDETLSGVYERALEDYLARRFGRRDDLPEVSETGLPPLLLDAGSIRIDSSLSPGDAQAARARLQSAGHAGRAGQGGSGETIVVGERYRWRIARQGRLVRYRCGGRWWEISSPRREYLLVLVRRLVSLLTATPAAMAQWRKTRRQSWPSPPTVGADG